MYSCGGDSHALSSLMEQLPKEHLDVAVLSGSVQDLAKVSGHLHVTRRYVLPR